MHKFIITSALVLPLLISSCVPSVTPEPTTNNTNTNPNGANNLINQDYNIPYGTAQTYAGNVGSRSAIFTLTWQPDGNVTGNYYHPNEGTSFQLRGKNTSDGQLVLTETTAGIQSAIITLRKSIKNSMITWSGTMHNTDGRVISVSFTRRS